MNPGRELDALVAEKVMGWKSFGEHWAIPGEANDIRRVHKKVHWRPSEDISAAWQVVSHMKSQSNGLFGFMVDLRLSEEWDAEFDMYDEQESYKATGDTAPHAICLAALKAVGVE